MPWPAGRRNCKAHVEFYLQAAILGRGKASLPLQINNTTSQKTVELQLIPAIILATALTLFRVRELVVEWADLMLDGDASKQRRLIGAKGFHSSRLMIVDGADCQIQDVGDLLDDAAKADQPNNFQLPRGESGHSLLHVTRHKVRFNPFTVAKKLARRTPNAAMHWKD